MQKRTSNSKYVKALIKLVCPDNDGRSRIFYPKEFVGEFECLSHNNGCNWARQARKIFKLKIKGFKKSFYFYIGLCVLVFILLTVIEVLTEETNVFSRIFSMLCGAGA